MRVPDSAERKTGTTDNRASLGAEGIIKGAGRADCARAAGESAPAATPHTTILRTDEAPAEIVVTFAPRPGGDYWVPVLNTFLDLFLPKISGAALRVMLILFRHRDRISGTTVISRADLLAATGLKSAGGLADAIRECLTAGCLTRAEGRDSYVVMPGCRFAGSDAKAAAPPPPAAAPPPVRHSERDSRGFATAKKDSPQRTAQGSTGFSSQFREENNDDDDDDVRVRLLMTKGPRDSDRPFAADDARGLLRMTGASEHQVRIALRNAWEWAKAGKVRSWRGFVRSQLENGATLFEWLERKDEHERAVLAAVESMIGDGELSKAETEAFVGWWNATNQDGRCKLLPRDVLANRFGGMTGTGQDRWKACVDRAIASRRQGTSE